MACPNLGRRQAKCVHIDHRIGGGNLFLCFTASYSEGNNDAPLQLSTTPSPTDTWSKCAPTMMNLSELPGSTQITLGSLDPFTGCSERCRSSQPASANICLSVSSRRLLFPAYFPRRASTIWRGTAS